MKLSHATVYAQHALAYLAKQKDSRLAPAQEIATACKTSAKFLFGFWLFVREWGRIGYSGQARIAAFPSFAEALAALQRQWQAKERRGYVPMKRASL